MNKINGFTLTELMIVVAIINLLAMVAIPKFGDMVIRAKEAHVLGNLGIIRSTISIYYADNEGQNPTRLDEALIPTYMSKFPAVTIPPIKAAGTPGHANVGLTWSGPITSICDAATKDIWLYVNQGPGQGSLLVNCTHVNSRGNVWSSY